MTPISTSLSAGSRSRSATKLAAASDRLRIGGYHRFLSPVFLIGACILVANLPYLSGLFHLNPLLSQSSLGVRLQPGILPGVPAVDPNDGFTAQALGHLAATDWLHGHLPWWNPFEGLGTPLAGEMQNASFLPLTLLLYFANGQVFLYLAFELIAAYSTYALLRRLALPEWPAFAGAVMFGLNGTFAWFHSVGGPIPFLPLTLLGVEIIRERARDGRPTRWWIVAVGIGLSLVAGFPETAYLDGLFAALWTLVRCHGLARTELRRYLGSLAAGIATGVGLAAPGVVPFVDYLPHALLGSNGLNLSHAYLPNQGFSQLLFPYVYGPIRGLTPLAASQATYVDMWGNAGGYLSVAGVLLAGLGLLDREHRPLKFALAGWSTLLVARAYGTPLAANLLGLIPGMNHVAAYRYMNPSLELAIAVLAAFGLRDLFERRTRPLRLLLVSAGVLATAILAVESAHAFARTIGGDAAWERASLLWGFGTLVAVVAVVALPKVRRVGTMLLVALLSFEAVAMLTIPEFSAPRGGQLDNALVTFLRDRAGVERYYSLGGAPPFPDYGSYFGVASLGADDLPTPKAYVRLVASRLDPNVRATSFDGENSQNPAGITPVQAFSQYANNYEAVGVKYLVLPTPLAPPVTPSVPLTAVYRDPLATVYQLPHPAPYFQDATPGCRVTLVTREQARVNCPAPSTLVRDELTMPGWTARVDGAPRPLGTTALAQETVRVPAGSHRITYDFTPPHETFAWLVLLLALAACLFASSVPQRFWSRRGSSPIGSLQTRLAGRPFPPPDADLSERGSASARAASTRWPGSRAPDIRHRRSRPSS